jgi:hypothetical protein
MVMLFMLSYLVVERPQQVLSSVAVMAAGLVIYAVAHGLGMTERDAR